jgi:hypothetical protein
MSRLIFLCLAVAAAIPFVLGFSGTLAWDNGLLWWPAILFGGAAAMGLIGAIEDTDERAARLVGGILGILGFLFYPLWYLFFVFYGSY